jgi:ABC-type multidrug transport system permease subunit
VGVSGSHRRSLQSWWDGTYGYRCAFFCFGFLLLYAVCVSVWYVYVVKQRTKHR